MVQHKTTTCKPAASTQNKHKVDINNYTNSYKKGPTHGHPDHPRRQQRLPVPWPSAKFQPDKVDTVIDGQQRRIKQTLRCTLSLKFQERIPRKACKTFSPCLCMRGSGPVTCPSLEPQTKGWGGKNKPRFLWPTAVKNEKLSNLIFCAPSLPHFCPWTPKEHTPRKVPCTELGAKELKARAPFGPLSQTSGIWQTYECVTRKCDKHPLILVDRMI